MVKLSLTLKSNQPSLIYSSDGKVYRLLPGANTLSLDYDSYVALAKTLNISPIKSREEAEEDNKPKVEEPKVEEPVEEPKVEEPVEEPKVEEVKDTVPEEVKSVEEVTKEQEPETVHEEPVMEELKEESKPEVEEQAKEPEPVQEEVKEDTNTEDTQEPQIDYSSMSYNKLKSLYKSITGKPCKLKKDELVDFLKENKTNV